MLIALEQGIVIDERYRIDGRLRRGGRGIVYTGRDLQVGDAVAIKTLRTKDSAMRCDIERETVAMGALNSTHIPPLRGAGSLIDGRPYFVVPFIDGMPLDQILDGGPLGIPAALDVAVGISRALDSAHQCGWLHRDVKPGNILVPAGNGHYAFDRAMLIDFGVCRRLSAADPLETTFGHIAGTPLYMAPEQIAGRVQTPASDIYGLGATLFHAVFGKPVVTDQPVELTARNIPGLPNALTGQLVVQLLTTEIEVPESATVPEGVRALLQSMLRRQAHRRPQSARELTATWVRLRVELSATVSQPAG